MKLPETLRALRHRNYRLYFTGMLAALAGVWMQQMAMGWLMYRLTDSVFMLGVVAFAWQIPVLLLGPLGGVLADRYDRRGVLLVTQSLGFVVTLVLALLTVTGRIESWHLVVISVLLGVVNAVDTPTRHSIARYLVDDVADLSNAISLNGLLYHFARMSGPAMGGLVLAFSNEATCFFINAAAYAVMLALLARMRLAKLVQSGAKAAGGVMAGLRYLAADPLLRSSVLLVMAVSFAVSPYSTVMPYFVRNVYGGDGSMLGILGGLSGAGAIATGIYMLARMNAKRLPWLIWRGHLVMGAMVVVYALSRSPWVGGAALLVLGAMMFIVTTGSNTVIQSHVREDMRGRVMAFYSMALVGMQPLGHFSAGAMGERIGTELWLAGCGVLSMLCSLAYRRAIRNLPRPE